MISPYVYPGFGEQECQNVINKMTEERNLGLFKKHILSIIGEHFGVTVEMLLSKRRFKEVVDARNLYMVCMKLKYNMSLASISFDLSKRHHSTVINSYLKFMNRYEREEVYRELSDSVFKKIGVTYNGEILTSKKNKTWNRKHKSFKKLP